MNMRQFFTIICLSFFTIAFAQKDKYIIYAPIDLFNKQKKVTRFYDQIQKRREGNVSFADIRQTLREGEMVLEISKIREKLNTFYIAFIIKKGYRAPRIYKLCSEIELFRFTQDKQKLYNSSFLTQWLFSSCVEEFEGIKNIFFAPFGEFNKMAIEYCPFDKPGQMFAEKFQIYRLSETSQLFDKTHNGNNSDWNCLIMGGIDYEVDNPQIVEQRFLGDIPNSNIGYLKDSYIAAKQIYEDLRHKNIKVIFKYNEDVSEQFVKQNLLDYNVLLIETHALYNEEICSLQKDDDILNKHFLLLSSAAYTLEGGVIPDNVEDGLLTAKEISQLDLHNLDLAVISACKSGLGVIEWDGVYGLMRGFKLAGVHSLVMTLDDVVDYVSGQLWIQFFRNLTNGQSKREALLNGIKYIRTMDNGAYSHPKYWTPFILIDGIE